MQENAKLTLRTEIRDNGFVSLTDISSDVELENISDVSGEVRRLSGALFIIDVINNNGIYDFQNADAEFSEGLEVLHNKANQIYSKIYKEQ